MEYYASDPGIRHADKPLLLFVHGAWHGMWCWRSWLNYFEQQGFGVVALSLRGHGKSSGTYRGARLEDYIEDVLGIINQLPEQPVLIGHSMGGYIVQNIVAETQTPFPAAVVISATTATGLPRGSLLRNSMRHPIIGLKSFVAFDMKPWIGRADIVKELFFLDTTPVEQVARYANLMSGESPRAIFDICKPASLSNPATPTLVIGGIHDAALSEQNFRKTAAQLNATCLMVPTAHDVMLEDPDFTIARQLADWLADN